MIARRTFLRIGGAAIAASPFAAAWADSKPKPKPKPKPAAAPKPRQPAVYAIGMKDMEFGGVPAELHVGDVIEWVNDDILVHTATAKDKSFDVVLKPKTRARTVLTAAGTIPFACRYHPGMKGVLVVVK